MLRRVLSVSRLDLVDFNNSANQVGVKVAGSICTKTSARASPSDRSDGEVACSITVVSLRHREETVTYLVLEREGSQPAQQTRNLVVHP